MSSRLVDPAMSCEAATPRLSPTYLWMTEAIVQGTEDSSRLHGRVRMRGLCGLPHALGAADLPFQGVRQ